jgi:hypothetical protein
VSVTFAPGTAAALEAQGWRVLGVPAGITLAGLRAAGAPFKGTKYFDRQAAATVEHPVAGGDVAYRPGLMPGSLARSFDAAARLVDDLQPRLPAGTMPIVGAAALYVWLLVEHRRRHGEWLLRQCYTWAADRSGPAHLAVGVFGEARPLIVSPVPEGSGQGLGVMPLVVPAGAGGPPATLAGDDN